MPPKIVKEVKLIDNKPPAALLSEPIRPFNTPPKTYSEAVERDQIWLCQWEKLAWQISEIRAYYKLNTKHDWLCIKYMDETESDGEN